MRIEQALARFRQLCAEAGLDVDRLMPWPTWKVFKAFMREPVDVEFDGASCQCGPADEASGTEAFAAFVRVFSDTDVQADEEDLLRGIVAELNLSEGSKPVLTPVEVHSHDFPSFTAFAQYVESLAEFQTVVNQVPASSEIYAQEL